jgi:hypothetical protein
LISSRLPIIVLAGAADDLNVQLANVLLRSYCKSYAVLSESASGVAIEPADGIFETPDQFLINGCLCCLGSVTLMAQLTRLLRAQRREQKYQGLLVIAGSHTRCDLLIDQLRQPLLADLVQVKSVVYAAHKISEIQSDAITSADVVYLSPNENESSVLTAPWLLALPGNDDRVFTFDIQQLRDLEKLSESTNSDNHWPAEKIFSRQNAHRLFEQAAMQGICFEAVLHTQRAWYHWKVLQDRKYTLLMQETTYRRNSYLHGALKSELPKRLAALRNALEFEN